MMSLQRKIILSLFATVAILVATLSTSDAHAGVTYYVAPPPLGNNASTTPTNSTTPYATIQKAIDSAHDFDTIKVASGTYNGVLRLNKKNNLTITKADTGNRPIITAVGELWNMIYIAGCQNLTFTGFEVDGGNTGPDDTNPSNNTGIECNAITIVPYAGPAYSDGTYNSANYVQSKNVDVNNCVVHDVGGVGITAYRNPRIVPSIVAFGCDYIRVAQNTIYNTNSTGQYDGSAISLLGCVSDGNYLNADGTPHFHNYVNNNRIYNNVNRNADTVESPAGSGNFVIDRSKHTDGNGIIIDFQLATGPWTLIANNLVYKNGGRGIHVFNSSNVYVLNNTVYKNNQDPNLASSRGELTVCNAQNVLVCNNVAQSIGGVNPAFRVYAYSGSDHTPLNGTVRLKYNTYTACAALPPSTEKTSGNGSSGTPPVLNSDSTVTNTAIDWSTTIYSDPAWGALFYNPDAASQGAADFRLNYLNPHNNLSGTAAQSARDRGSNTLGEYASKDFTYLVRYLGTSVDRGAYEQ